RHARRRAGKARRRARRREARRRRQRQRARLLREARLRRAATQYGLCRRRMARQHDTVEAAHRQTEHAMKKPDTPFPRHWLYYIVLKIAIIVLAVAVATKYFGLW